jgi:hypothetical protein
VQDVSVADVNEVVELGVSNKTYQLFHKRDERLQILFEREMELIAVF